MRDQDEETERLAKILDHPARARIIELLGQRGPLGWKELSAGVGVRTGALYHHLDALEGLVSRDENKKYFLTKAGRTVHSHISEGRTIDSVHRAARELREAGRWQRQLASVFVPRSLLDRLTSTPARAASTLVGFAVSLVALSVFDGVYPTLYFFQETEVPATSVIGFAASLGALLAVSLVATRLLKSDANVLPMGATTAVSFLPVVAFTHLANVPPLIALSKATVPYTASLVFFQTWSATILGAGISTATGMRIERGLLVSLVVLYATMVLVFLQGRIV